MIKLRVTGMTCNHCVKRVATALGRMPNAGKVDVNLDQGQATVEGNVDVGAAIAAVKAAGYDAVAAT